MNRINSLQIIFLTMLSVLIYGQERTSYSNQPREYNFVPVNDEKYPCITEFEYNEMRRQIAENASHLVVNKSQFNTTSSSIKLEWPLRRSSNLKDSGYYFISAFVDMDNTSAIKDWNCGTRTYNGHRGTDIAAWPFSWNKMDNKLVEVIAAAPGKIVGKINNKFDRVCKPTGSELANYVLIQHADGTLAGYIHLKQGSATSKSIGDSVTTGEYIGIVGSAGISSGVHLHFEIYSDATLTKPLDPFYGPCNTTIDTSLWANQNPDADPQILKLSLHSNWPYLAACPNTIDSLYEVDSFISIPNLQAVFNVFTKHVTAGMTWNFKILNPDSTIFDSWEYTSLSNRTLSNLGWKKNLPTDPGTYTYEVIFNGFTQSKIFTIKDASTSIVAVVRKEIAKQFVLAQNYPNPFNPSTVIRYELPTRSHVLLKVYDAIGREVAPLVNEVKEPGQYSVNFDASNLPSGIYFYTLLAGEFITTKKIALLK